MLCRPDARPFSPGDFSAAPAPATRSGHQAFAEPPQDGSFPVGKVAGVGVASLGGREAGPQGGCVSVGIGQQGEFHDAGEGSVGAAGQKSSTIGDRYFIRRSGKAECDRFMVGRRVAEFTGLTMVFGLNLQCRPLRSQDRARPRPDLPGDSRVSTCCIFSYTAAMRSIAVFPVLLLAAIIGALALVRER